jgi:hypothetical protein
MKYEEKNKITFFFLSLTFFLHFNLLLVNFSDQEEALQKKVQKNSYLLPSEVLTFIEPESSNEVE